MARYSLENDPFLRPWSRIHLAPSKILNSGPLGTTRPAAASGAGRAALRLGTTLRRFPAAQQSFAHQTHTESLVLPECAPVHISRFPVPCDMQLSGYVRRYLLQYLVYTATPVTLASNPSTRRLQYPSTT
jgi:hypothetical protein